MLKCEAAGCERESKMTVVRDSNESASGSPDEPCVTRGTIELCVDHGVDYLGGIGIPEADVRAFVAELP